MGLFNKTKKQRQQLLVEEKLKLDENISHLSDEVQEKLGELERINKDVHSLEERINRRKRKVSSI